MSIRLYGWTAVQPRGPSTVRTPTALTCEDLLPGGCRRSYWQWDSFSFNLGGMARNEIRPVLKLRSTAGTGFTYVTRKNRRNDPDRLSLRKFDPVAGRHVEFREER
ncbi:ribosomal protein L33 [Streptomyces filamentosus]